MRYSGPALKLSLYSLLLVLLSVMLPRSASATSAICTLLDPPFCASNGDNSMSTVDAGGGVFIGNSADGFGTLPWTGTPVFTTVEIAYLGVTLSGFTGTATLTPGLVNVNDCGSATQPGPGCPTDPTDPTQQLTFPSCAMSVTPGTIDLIFMCPITTTESNDIVTSFFGSGTTSIWTLLESDTQMTITAPTNGQNAVLFYPLTATPEPSSLLLLAGGISALGLPLRRRRTSVSSR